MAAEVKKIRERISQEFKKDLMEVFAKRDAEGKITPNEEQWTVEETKREEYTKAEEAFGERIAEIDRPKLTTHDIRDIKPTADEIDALLPILDPSGFDAPEEPSVAGPMGKTKLRQA